MRRAMCISKPIAEVTTETSIKITRNDNWADPAYKTKYIKNHVCGSINVWCYQQNWITPNKVKPSYCPDYILSRKENWGAYCKVPPKVAHHFFIVFPFSAYSTGKAGIPLQPFSDTILNNPATKICRTRYYDWYWTILITGY